LTLAENDMAKAQAKKQGNRELGVVRYLRETRAELKKVTWPTQKEALNLTYIVLGVTIAFALFLGVLDWLFSRLFQLFI
jgi:preprotein translocase subunit SecE